MAGTWTWYGNGLLKVMTGAIDLDTDTLKIMLTTSAYTPNQDTHDFRDDVTNEVGASGTYSAGGGTIAGKAVTYDAATNEVRFVWDDLAFTGATITARTAVLYKSRGGAASADELIAYCTESADVSSTASTFTVDVPTTAVLKVTVS
jgi:hypothetical protein